MTLLQQDKPIIQRIKGTYTYRDTLSYYNNPAPSSF